MGEVHAVYAGDRGRNGQDRGPGGELAGDDSRALLLKETAELEHGSEHVAQAVDHSLDAAHMVEHVAEIGPCLGVDPRKVQSHKLRHHLGRRGQHTLEADQLAADLEDAIDFAAGKKTVHRPLFHRQHLVFEGFSQRQIAVDKEVQDGVEDIVNAMAEHGWRRLELDPQVGMAPARGAADADDMAVAHEEGGLAVAYGAVLQPGCPGHHKELVTENVQFGQLLALCGVLDGQGMEAVALLQGLQLFPGRINEADPYEL